MREARDGLVETPKQYRLVAELLGLPDSGRCGRRCRLRQGGRSARAAAAVLDVTNKLLMLPKLFLDST
jgi:hypothetical protein